MSKISAQDALGEYLGPDHLSKYTFTKIHRSKSNEDLRSVYAARSSTDSYALKVDHSETGQALLAREFDYLRTVARDLENAPDHHVVEACHLSAEHRVLITRLLNDPTLREIAQQASTVDELSDAMTQAGEWLRSFHRSTPHHLGQFWPGWMFKQARGLLATLNLSAPKTALATKVIAALERQAQPLKGCEAPFGRRHDDLNGANLLLGLNNQTTGLDLPGLREGMQLTDASQILCDIDLHQSVSSNPWPDVCPPVFYGFTKGFGKQFNHELLRFLCRMQFLFLWLRITPERALLNPNVAQREARLEERLSTVIDG